MVYCVCWQEFALGNDLAPISRIIRLNTNKAKPEAPLAPSARRSSGACVTEDGFYVYGGFGIDGTVKPDSVGNDLWLYKRDWELIYSAPGPYAARLPSLCQSDSGFLMFGGCGVNGASLKFYNEIWQYDGTWNNIRPVNEIAPVGRYSSASVYRHDQLLVFGGNYITKNWHQVFLGDLWIFDMGNRSWRQYHGKVREPGRRYGFGWASDRDCLYIFGGFDGRNDLGDLWSFSLETHTWRLLAKDGPDPRYCPALGIVDGDIILFGGRSKRRPKENYSDTWKFDGTWQRLDFPLHSASPSYHAKTGYGSDGKGLFLFGGEGSHGHLNDLWKFTQGSWQELVKSDTDAPSILW